ncbi:MAG: methionyl-tRNA formyltransferase, partial [Erysipelotrichaceae bacterium]|nr:methionyl-tRNA formyltransferase [Erysipelotrichaceae bacterium]
MENPRIVFFGTPAFAAGMLKTLIEMKYQVVLAVTQPDKPVGRKKIIQRTPVAALADENQIDVLQPVRLKDMIDEILAYKPDLIVTCAYGQFVPSRILEAPSLGCVNVHPSLLPKYRGGAPIQRAIMN